MVWCSLVLTTTTLSVVQTLVTYNSITGVFLHLTTYLHTHILHFIGIFMYAVQYNASDSSSKLYIWISGQSVNNILTKKFFFLCPCPVIK